MRFRGIAAAAEDEIVIAIGRGKRHADRALPRRDELHLPVWRWLHTAVIHREVLALEVGDPVLPKPLHHLDILGRIVVAITKIGVAGPHAHLIVFGLLPPGDDVYAEAAARDAVDCRRHPRDDCRRQSQDCGGSEELNLGRNGGEPGHQRERFQIVVPEFARSAKSAQLDHRKREIQAVILSPLHDFLVELKRRHVLRRGRGDQPAVVSNGNENAHVHRMALLPCEPVAEPQARRAPASQLMCGLMKANFLGARRPIRAPRMPRR